MTLLSIFRRVKTVLSSRKSRVFSRTRFQCQCSFHTKNVAPCRVAAAPLVWGTWGARRHRCRRRRRPRRRRQSARSSPPPPPPPMAAPRSRRPSRRLRRRAPPPAGRRSSTTRTRRRAPTGTPPSSACSTGGVGKRRAGRCSWTRVGGGTRRGCQAKGDTVSGMRGASYRSAPSTPAVPTPPGARARRGGVHGGGVTGPRAQTFLKRWQPPRSVTAGACAAGNELRPRRRRGRLRLGAKTTRQAAPSRVAGW